MPTLHILAGLPGAGKTTLARKLEMDEHALRLTPDEWMARIVGDGWDDKRRAAVEATMWEIAARVLTLGISVVLDFGFWTRAERDDFRARAQALGADARVHFCDVPYTELVRRLEARNANLPPDTFAVTAKDLDEMIPHFERPTVDELG